MRHQHNRADSEQPQSAAGHPIQRLRASSWPCMMLVAPVLILVPVMFFAGYYLYM